MGSHSKFHLFCRVLSCLASILEFGAEQSLADSAATYAGSLSCSGCHAKETSAWKGSDHERAMDHANPKSVLGDFNQTNFRYAGVTSSFFKKGDSFFVRTDDADGKLAEFQIEFTFGFYPLQQYLIRLPAGRLQALSIAWDTRPKDKGGQRWLHLYPNERVDHEDSLHWTKISQNWNHQCAECHSTDLRKHYDPNTRRFDTKWSEISVGCEACHGPGSLHNAWAKKSPDDRKNFSDKGLMHSLKLPIFEAKPDSATGKTLAAPERTHAKEIDTCARCHARRALLTENYVHGRPLLDTHLPALLTAESYFSDGQISGEVYEYGSFLQSKMYQSGVTCSNCHDPHSSKLRMKGNALCGQCHNQKKYDQTSHHFHPAGSIGAECKSCHMPQKTYMQVDQRYDHGFRIPQPALAAAVGAPDTCLACHQGKTSVWSQERIDTWSGVQSRSTGHFSVAFDNARKGSAASVSPLVALVEDLSKSEIVRATALSELRAFMDATSIETVKRALADKDAMVRSSALRALEGAPSDVVQTLALPLLKDPVRAVRIEAALLFAPISNANLTVADQEVLKVASNEYIEAQRANAEAPQAQVNLGLFYSSQGKFLEAERAYREALVLEKSFVPAYVNLADLLREHNRDAEGERILKDGLVQQPKSGELYFALALLHVRTGMQHGKNSKALEELKLAVQFNPANAHYAYVYIVALQDVGMLEEADTVLRDALQRHPSNEELSTVAHAAPH